MQERKNVPLTSCNMIRQYDKYAKRLMTYVRQNMTKIRGTGRIITPTKQKFILTPKRVKRITRR